ncbi:hypothetical protein [Prevotella pallens]|jgi:hypothetical protein|uniref:Uncharacterized protein n=2 Tax=Prevotella pallens TaxID=60133 RepID=F9DGK3_9BACT|nr:hypothetical protein [Prevotella pallens]EGQ20043.1 hypothetical protein HMPREF9144_0793 [Prevotella pallens ATCC 700821]MBF1467943.1 hypothetical protein [Prevotella pallens]
MKRLITLIFILYAFVIVMAQSQQTYQPYFQKGQCVNYEYSYKVICRNIADGKTNNTINGYQLLQADNMNNIFERAKPGEVYDNAFSLRLIEATNYTYTMELDITKPCNITKVVTEQERKIIEAVTKAFQNVKPIITFPKDMSSLIINNKRELIKEIGLNLWKTVANNTQVVEELNNDVPTLDETVRQTMEQFGEGNALFDELDIICPGFKTFTLAYCQPFVLGQFVSGPPLDGKNKDEVYQKESASISKKGELDFASSTDFFRLANIPLDTITTSGNNSDAYFIKDLPQYTTEDDVLCTIEINIQSNSDTWVNHYRASSMARFENAIWTGIEDLKRTK